MKDIAANLIAEFSDKEYAHAYMEEHCISRIAAQIHSMRKDRGWSQAELAERAGMTQERISKIENADFSSLTMSTLRKFSEAFDVHLHIAFLPFSQGIIDVANLSEELVAESRESDLKNMSRQCVRILQRKNMKWDAIDVSERMRVVPIRKPVSIGPATIHSWTDLGNVVASHG